MMPFAPFAGLRNQGEKTSTTTRSPPRNSNETLSSPTPLARAGDKKTNLQVHPRNIARHVTSPVSVPHTQATFEIKKFRAVPDGWDSPKKQTRHEKIPPDSEPPRENALWLIPAISCRRFTHTKHADRAAEWEYAAHVLLLGAVFFNFTVWYELYGVTKNNRAVDNRMRICRQTTKNYPLPLVKPSLLPATLPQTKSVT